jgi:hypothetical protein
LNDQVKALFHWRAGHVPVPVPARRQHPRRGFPLVGVSPALDRFTDLARQLRQEAEEQARRHGRELGAAVAITPPKAA